MHTLPFLLLVSLVSVSVVGSRTNSSSDGSFCRPIPKRCRPLIVRRTGERALFFKKKSRMGSGCVLSYVRCSSQEMAAPSGPSAEPQQQPRGSADGLRASLKLSGKSSINDDKAASTSTEATTTSATSAPPPPAAKDEACFPGDQTTRLHNGQRKSLKDLQIGDEVEVWTANGLGFSTVLHFHHRVADETLEYLEIETLSGRSLSVSALHLLLFWEDGFRFAKRAEESGAQLSLLVDGTLQADEVVSVRRVEKAGVFAPVTAEGTLVVVDLLASCYTNLESHNLLHGFHSFLRRVMGSWHEVLEATSEAPKPLLLLNRISHLVAPLFPSSPFF